MLQVENLSATPKLRQEQPSRIKDLVRDLVPTSDMKLYQVESDSIDDRVAWLALNIDEGKRSERVRQIASTILTAKDEAGQWKIPERDWQGELRGAFDYVRANVRYTRDIHEVELFQKADRTLELKIGDCDDMAILLGSILGNIGFPLLIRVISVDKKNDYHHVYLLAGMPPENPKEWIALDASQAEGPGWEVQYAKKQDYEVSTS